MSRHPEVTWAQRQDKLFLTIDLPDAKEPKVKVEEDGKFTFSGIGGHDSSLFELDLNLNGKIDVPASKISVTPRHIFCVLTKAELGFWPRLLKESGKTPSNVKVDWDKWVDEDEEAPPGMDNFDLSSMADMSKFDFGGGGGGDEGDSDDEDAELPELEK